MKDVANNIEVEKIPAHVFRYVERELYDYPAHKAAVDNYHQERMSIIGINREWPPPEGRREAGRTSDATLETMLRLDALEMRTQRARRNVSIIEAIFSALKDEEAELVRFKYWSKHQFSAERTAKELNMGRSRYFELRHEVVRKFALGFGLL